MEEKTHSKQRWLIPVLLGAVILLLAVILVSVFLRPNAESDTAGSNTPKLGYAEGATALDEAGLQKAVDDLYEVEDSSLVLEFQNDAVSEDGTNFTCYLANAKENNYDMYIQIFADQELTDQLLLTGLVRPGDGFQELTLDRALDPGSHTVYVVFTQVEDDLETVHGQIVYTMNFFVRE